jgi:hypothetical protein
VSRDDCGDGSAAHLNRKGHHLGNDGPTLSIRNDCAVIFRVFDGVFFLKSNRSTRATMNHIRNTLEVSIMPLIFGRLQRLLDLSTAIHDPYGLFDRQEWCRLPP